MRQTGESASDEGFIEYVSSPRRQELSEGSYTGRRGGQQGATSESASDAPLNRGGGVGYAPRSERSADYDDRDSRFTPSDDNESSMDQAIAAGMPIGLLAVRSRVE